ncbi:hypothetical protein [Oxalobacter formigenes]|jgi:hypothetical protein
MNFFHDCRYFSTNKNQGIFPVSTSGFSHDDRNQHSKMPVWPFDMAETKLPSAVQSFHPVF